MQLAQRDKLLNCHFTNPRVGQKLCSTTPRLSGHYCCATNLRVDSDSQNAVVGIPNAAHQNPILFKIVSTLFGIEPLWNFARNKARQKIYGRGSSIGVDVTAEIEAIENVSPDWDAALREIENTSLDYPNYYTKPFHAYDAGNLSWEAAFQHRITAKLVHANVMDPENKTYSANGDDEMRGSYSEKMLKTIQEEGGSIENVVDLGCATGLSSHKLQKSFPEASVIGLDLSPYFLAVGHALQANSSQGDKRPVKFLHRKAEDTGLPTGKTDLVSMCLLLHELPQSATKAILNEAVRILRPGGFLSIMEMNPASQRFARMSSNPFAYVPFKATEPWLEEYVSLDLHQLLKTLGFKLIRKEPSTPGHFTLVAQKV